MAAERVWELTAERHDLLLRLLRLNDYEISKTFILKCIETRGYLGSYGSIHETDVEAGIITTRE